LFLSLLFVCLFVCLFVSCQSFISTMELSGWAWCATHSQALSLGRWAAAVGKQSKGGRGVDVVVAAAAAAAACAERRQELRSWAWSRHQRSSRRCVVVFLLKIQV
jgi:hypothetical protein